MDFNLVIQQIIILFSLLAAGFTAKKLDILDDHSTRKLTGFLINITIPALIMKTMSSNSSIEKYSAIIILGISVVYYTSLFIVAKALPLIVNLNNSDKGIHQFMMMFSNVGFMGLPVISSLFGSEGVFYAIIFNLPYYTLMFTIGMTFLSGHKNKKLKMKDFLTPPIIANMIGLTMFFCGLSFPKPVTSALNAIGGMTTSLALVVVGASLTNIKIRSMLIDIRHYLYVLYKLLIIPAAVLFILRMVGFSGKLLAVIVILSGMPVASNTVILSKKYNLPVDFAAESVFFNTLLSSISIPLMVYLLTHFQVL
jgi:malate permease and related proteins